MYHFLNPNTVSKSNYIPQSAPDFGIKFTDTDRKRPVIPVRSGIRTPVVVSLSSPVGMIIFQYAFP